MEIESDRAFLQELKAVLGAYDAEIYVDVDPITYHGTISFAFDHNGTYDDYETGEISVTIDEL